MKRIYQSADQLAGGTPLLQLSNIEKGLHLKASVIAKLKMLNPAGSVKDRIAKAMIEDAESKGFLKPGATIIEPTSGNTGIGLSAMAAAKGLQGSHRHARNHVCRGRALMKAYGAELVLTDGAEGMKGAIAKAEKLAAEIPGAFIPGQFDNAANPKVHRETTGPEIWQDTDGEVDIFVAGIGTGGTITGVGEYLKAKNPQIKIVAVEPAASPPALKGHSRSPQDPGHRRRFLSHLFSIQISTMKFFVVENEDAFATGRLLGQTEGLLAGISSGAALFAALQLAQRAENEGKNIVVLLPDSGDRYLSTPLFSDK